MGKIVAIGGGEIKNFETLSIDRAITKLTGKKKPKALFIPTASGDAEGYWQTFQKVYGKRLGCRTDKLFLLREKPTNKEITKKIKWADLIYVGGGNTLRMLKIWRRKGVDKELKKAYKRGTVLSGLSAGAVCWFRYTSSDFRKFRGAEIVHPNAPLARISGLNFINATCSPHHTREKDRTPGLKKLMRKTPGVGIALDDNAAIVIVDDKYKVITSEKKVGVHRAYCTKGKIKYELVQKTKAFKPLSELLSR